MRKWFLFLVVSTVALLTTSILIAQTKTTDPFVGTWKLNLAKSTFDPGPPPKSRTLKMEPAPNGLKHIRDEINAQGQSAHVETVFTFDGKEYPNPGNAQPPATIAATRINGSSYETVTRVNGKLTITERATASPDGKTRTSTQ